MVHNFASVIALAIHALSHATASDECSVEKSCNCFQVDGKQSARCSANLTRIPKFYATFRIMRLELDQNQFGVIRRKHFDDIGSWPQLQELSLKDCNIQTLEIEAFYGLSNLRQLYLSRNRLRTISHYDAKTQTNLHGYFDELIHLKELDLSHNRLKELRGSPFRLNWQLQILDLSDNQLEFLSVAAFEGPKSLHTIRLIGNRFTRLFLEPFRGLDHLRTLNVQGNPFHCDCHLRPFFMYTEKYKFSRGTTCDRPGRLVGRVWQDIKPHEFACHVEMLHSEERSKAPKSYVPGSTVTFKCGAQGDPRPNITWELAKNGTRIRIPKLIKLQPERFSLDQEVYNKQKFGHPAIDTTLTIQDIGMSDTGRYHCVADNLHTDAYEVYDLSLTAKTPDQPFKVTLPPPSRWLMIATGVAIALLVIALIVAVFVCFRRRRSRPAPVYTHMNGNGYKYIGTAGRGSTVTDAAGATNVTPPANGSAKPEKPTRTFEHKEYPPPAWMEPVHVAALEKQNGNADSHKAISCYTAANTHLGQHMPAAGISSNGIIAAGPNQPIIIADTRSGRGMVASAMDEVTYLPVMDHHGSAGPQDGDSGYLEGITPPIPPSSNPPLAPSMVVASTNSPCVLTHHRRNGPSSLYGETAPLARTEITDSRIPLRETSL